MIIIKQCKKFQNLFLLLFLSSLITRSISQLFQLTSINTSISNNYTLVPGVSYDLNFSMSSVSIPASSTVSLKFSQHFQINQSNLANCKASTSSSIAPVTIPCTPGYFSAALIYQIVFTSIFPSTTTYSFLRLGFQIPNPTVQISQPINLTVYNPSSTMIGYGLTYISSYKASIMTGCGVQSASILTGANATHTYKLTPSQRLVSNAYLLIDMPVWYDTIGNQATSNLICTGLQGTDLTSLNCAMQSPLTTQTMNITSGIVSANRSASLIQLSITDLRNPWSVKPFGPITISMMIGSLVSQVCTDVYNTVTSPNTLNVFSFSLSNLAIGATNTNVRLQFFPKTLFPTPGNRLTLQFSSQFTITYTGTITIFSQNSTQITLAGVSVYSISGFTVRNPPSTRPFTFRATTYVVDQGVAYAIETRTVTNSTIVGAVSGVTVSAGTRDVNQITGYGVTFTITNRLQIGSFVNVVFPAQLSVQSGATCSITGHTCIVTGNNATITLASAVTDGSSLSVSVNSVKNANQALTTSSFAIYTYYDSLYDSLVNQITSGVTITMTAKLITTGSVTPSSFTTYASASYKISVTPLDPIPSGSSLTIIFPSTITPISSQLLSASFTSSSCFLSAPSSSTLTLTSCFSSSIPIQPLFVNFSSIRNPPSFKPSDSIKFYIYGPSSNLINSIESTLTVTMNVAATIQSFSVSPNTFTVGSIANYDIVVGHTINHQVGDYGLLAFPTLMNGSVLCSAVTGITGVICTNVSSSKVKIAYGSVPASSITVNIANITNYLIGDQAVSFSFQIYDIDNFKMQQYLSLSISYTQSTLTSATVNNNNNIALGQLSNLTLTVSNSLTLYSTLSASLTQLDITIPPEFTIGSTCLSTSGSCSKISSSQYRVTSIGLSLSNINITMPNVLLSYYNPTSTSFSLVYTYNGFNVSVRDSGVVAGIYCTSPCRRCSGSVTMCQSCMPAPNAMIYHDNVTKTCGLTCVSGKYADTNNQCQLCVSPCSTCTSLSACLTCVANMWLYQTNCLAICPSTYFNASNGKCQQCQSPCNQCASLTSCKNCATGYFNPSSNWCVNASACPNGTYANTTTMTCQNCLAPCQTCSLSQTNCTSCRTGYLYYSNLCVQNCPPGMYQASSYCFSCTGLCATCTNSTFCTSCSSNYLTQNGSCVDSQSCPSSTYPNATTLQCMTCPTGCLSCTNSTNCTACQSSVYKFYEYGCYSVCPFGTYQSGIICVACTAPCASCRGTDTNCTSCVVPNLFYLNTCVGVCPDGTYDNNGTCTACMTVCYTCSSGTSCNACDAPYYLQNGQCVTQCSAGYYGDNTTSSCSPCQGPCSQCSFSPTNCTKCIAPQYEYLNGCVNSCPGTYFVINGSCKTCPNCVNCLDSTTCGQCRSGYYLLSGICYATCPSTAPIPDDVTNTCGRCDLTCLTCSNIAKNCTSCYSNTFLHKGSCLTECPLGFIQDLISGTCKEPLIGNIIYFPFSFLFLFFFLITIASKCFYSQTQIITSLASLISMCQFCSWCLLCYIVTLDYTLDQSIISIIKYLALTCILLSVTLGLSFSISVCKLYEHDKGLLAWKQFQPACLYTYRAVSGLSLASFRIFRVLYSRLFGRTFFTLYVADGERFLTSSNRLGFVSLIGNSLPMIVICAFAVYKKQIYDQTFFCALDTVFLGFFAGVVLTIDSCKNKDHFQSIKEGLPFLKYKNMRNQDSLAGQSLLSRMRQQNQRPKSEIDQKQRDKIFKKITWLPNLNKFGHLNILQETPDTKDQTKSLPQQNKLNEYKQYDPYHNSDNDIGDRVIDDLYFLQQQEQKRRREEQEREREREEEERRKKQEEERERQMEQEREEERRRLKKKREEEEEEKRRKEEEERRRRELMEEDERERVQLEFPDLAAIDKVENKNGKSRKNPLDLLSNCKKTDQKPIDEKALKKLEQIGKKNGIDPNFMKQTFGVQKNHNPELLNQIIDKHNHVKRQSVKQLFNGNNNPQILQQLFGKNSKMDPKKLKQILNDPDSQTMIKKLVDKEEGLLSAQMAKQLFDQNGNFSKQFTKQLLSQGNGMDPDKLKKLLKESNGKGKDSPLKALKKIGGENLENKQLLNNMMGEDAVLDPENFTKVANDLSLKAIQNIFANKSKNSDIITKKILNNKKLNLKNLAPILQDQQLLQELAQALGSDDPNLQQNLINLFKNAQNIDPQKLKQLLADPHIRDKLLSKPVDPSFLASLLDKNSNSDLKILSNAIKNMSDQSIAETFKFDPEKNIDFKNLAGLFDANSKTDPQLVAKMLEPDMVKKLYVKGNDTKMLNKLVEKGSQFDPQVIKNVYGDQRNNIFDTNTQQMGNNNNFLTFDEDKGQQFRSQKQYSLGFQKNHKSQANMSRTAGGVLSFLTPIVPINNNIKNSTASKMKGKPKQFGETNKDQWTSQGQGEDQEQFQQDQDGQIGEQDLDFEQGTGKARRKKKVKKIKKKLVDIRHPAQQVYLQRIQAPHQAAMRKASIRKKKKKVQNPGVMDQDNDIFDMDF